MAETCCCLLFVAVAVGGGGVSIIDGSWLQHTTDTSSVNIPHLGQTYHRFPVHDLDLPDKADISIPDLA